MKSLIFSLLCVFGPFCAMSQDHQTNRRTLSRHLREVYDVLKTNWKIKDGRYAVINDDGFTVVKGSYSDGKKTGTWDYYDNDGKLVQRYDFTGDSLVFQSADSTSIVHDSFDIPQGVDDSSKMRPPYKIGGPEYGFYLLYDERDIPAGLKASSARGQMTYVLTINEQGRLEDYTLLFAGEAISDMVIHRSVRGLPAEALEFSAATVEGKPVRSKISFVIPIDVNHVSVPGTNNIITQHGVSHAPGD
jgi:hypothetical protein